MERPPGVLYDRFGVSVMEFALQRLAASPRLSESAIRQAQLPTPTVDSVRPDDGLDDVLRPRLAPPGRGDLRAPGRIRGLHVCLLPGGHGACSDRAPSRDQKGKCAETV